MSRNTKIALIVVGSLSVICIGVCAIAFLVLPRIAGNVVSQDPASAKRVAAGIAEYTLPDGYAEIVGMDLLVYKMTVIGPQNRPDDGMIFMLMGTNTATGNRGEMQRQMQQAFQQQYGRGGSAMEVVGQEPVKIRGQEVTLTIAENDAEPHLRQAIGAFDGKNGLVVVMAMGDASSWDNALLHQFLESIQ
jgi:hypothetical protein